MIIGIPKEIMHDEARVSATPETVKKMVADGNVVLVENGAGVGSFFPDADYAAAGATMVADCEEIFAKACKGTFRAWRYGVRMRTNKRNC